MILTIINRSQSKLRLPGGLPSIAPRSTLAIEVPIATLESIKSDLVRMQLAGVIIWSTDKTSDDIDDGAEGTTVKYVDDNGGGGGGVPPTRLIDTTFPLQGGADLSADITLSIAPAGTSNAGSMSALDKQKLDGLPSTAPPTTRTLTAGNGLTGGGDLSADRSFAVLAANGSVSVTGSGISVVYGASANTAAQGNDARLSDARTPLAHAVSHATGQPDAISPSSIGAAAASITLTAGTGLSGGGDLTANRSFAVTYGSSAGTSCEGNDARLSDARAPIAHASTHATGQPDAISPASIGAVVTSRNISAGTGLTGGGDLSADRSFAVVYGSSASTSCEGNDARLSDARTPLSHGSSHAGNGTDPVPSATTSISGLMSAADKLKLDGIATAVTPLFYGIRGFDASNYLETAINALPGNASPGFEDIIAIVVRDLKTPVVRLAMSAHQQFSGPGRGIGTSGDRPTFFIADGTLTFLSNSTGSNWVSDGESYRLLVLSVGYDGTNRFASLNNRKFVNAAQTGYTPHTGVPLRVGAEASAAASPLSDAWVVAWGHKSNGGLSDAQREALIMGLLTTGDFPNGALTNRWSVFGQTSVPATVTDQIGAVNFSLVGSSLVVERIGHAGGPSWGIPFLTSAEISTAAPVNVGVANATGSSVSLARADHVHAGIVIGTIAGTSHSVTDADNLYVYRCTSGSTVTVTVGAGLAPGTTVEFVQEGAGQVQIAGSGVTLRVPAAFNPYTAQQWSSVVITVLDTDETLVRGDLDPV